MSNLKHSTGYAFGAMAVMALASMGPGKAVAAEELGSQGIEGVSGDGSSVVDKLEQDSLEMAQYHRPPPPRGYRVYRPYYHVRVVPPPTFTPGWWGFYFWGVRPPPPPAPPQPVTPAPVARARGYEHVKEYSLGVSAGTYGGMYTPETGLGEYYDPGVRFALSYRNAPSLSGELAVGMFGSNMRLDGTGSDVRSDVPIQLSAVLHAFPRSPIQPFFLFGGTGNIRTYRGAEGSDTGNLYSEFRAGVHVGVGLECLIGDNISLTVDGRSILYTLSAEETQYETYANDVTGMMGLNFYF